ncbi:hypothetical protein BCR36DRAFT_301500 [Piromyces finnis]|uniref:Gfd2/YDR514C-like C-terminal domain-containing protein n=1 Tax=Piromyces finnis TaxID=1754191 RepID=A0A1Y1V0C8_9FUNG|nr:hypothetical protein BCR36DRAFT_301500 [Piromyces finnis]|eukprot:ORX44519.1 hypothetical protein BCR36DRAFT_301500 [Piromyces finnis]
MWDIIINKNIIPSFILYPDYYITAITCKKIKNLQYNIKLINEFQNKVKNDRKIIVIDTESYENDLNIITEFGWCVFNVDGKIIKEQHFIVKEYYNLRNGNYVPDNKDHYIFGKSQHKSLNEINKILQDEINCADFIIGYGIHNDIKYLKNSGIEFSKFSFIDGEIFNPNRKYIIEMYDFHSAYFLKAPSILKYGLKDFQIKYKYLDNAGNDSHYIMKYFLKFIKNFNINSKKYSRILNINVPTNFSSCKFFY